MFAVNTIIIGIHFVHTNPCQSKVKPNLRTWKKFFATSTLTSLQLDCLPSSSLVASSNSLQTAAKAGNCRIRRDSNIDWGDNILVPGTLRFEWGLHQQ